MAWDRWMRRRRAPDAEPARAGPLLGLSFLGVLTHPTLDWMNTYGMRWALPFDGTWSYGDSLFIIDPWIWLALGGAVFLASSADRNGLVAWAFLAAVSSLVVLAFPLAVGAKAAWLLGLATITFMRVRRGPKASGASALRARGALVAVALYIAVLLVGDAFAQRHVREAASAAGLEVRDVMVAPQPAAPFSSEVEVLTNVGYVPGEHRWLRSPRVRLYPEDIVPVTSGPPGLDSVRRDEIIAAARAHPDVEFYHVWSRYPYVRVDAAADGWLVRFSDARYDGRPGGGGLSGITVPITSEDPR